MKTQVVCVIAGGLLVCQMAGGANLAVNGSFEEGEISAGRRVF